MRSALPIVGQPSVEAIEALRAEFSVVGMAALRLVLVDGVFAPQLSSVMPDGVTVRSLASVLAGERTDLIALLASEISGGADPILSLNAALMQDGVVIEVAPGAIVNDPIDLVHAATAGEPSARFTRSLIVVGAGASVGLAESHHVKGSRAADACNGLQDFNCLIASVGAGASLNHCVMLNGAEPDGLRVDSLIATLGAGAAFDSFALVTGAGLTRRQIFMRFDGAGAKGSLRGVSLLRGRAHADTTLVVEHAAPGCSGRQMFRHILDDEATGVFQGRIKVDPLAQKTDARMLSKALLLSDMAAMNNKPELEIFADDVACGHGATSGGLDPDQLFYLQTRGLPFAQAEALLLEAFAAELIDGVAYKDLAEIYRAEIRSWLARRALSSVGA